MIWTRGAHDSYTKRDWQRKEQADSALDEPQSTEVRHGYRVIMHATPRCWLHPTVAMPSIGQELDEVSQDQSRVRQMSCECLDLKSQSQPMHSLLVVQCLIRGLAFEFRFRASRGFWRCFSKTRPRNSQGPWLRKDSPEPETDNVSPCSYGRTRRSTNET